MPRAGPIGPSHRSPVWRAGRGCHAPIHHHAAVHGGLMIAAICPDATETALERRYLAVTDVVDSIARGAPLEITLQRITQMIEQVITGTHCAVGVLEPDGAIRCHAAPN